MHNVSIKLLTAKVYVSSDSVLCLSGKCQADLGVYTSAGKQNSVFYGHDQYYELISIDGEPVVFEWKIFAGHTTLELVQEIQKFMNEVLKTTPHDFKHKTRCIYLYVDVQRHRMDKNIQPRSLPKLFLKCCRIRQKFFSKDIGQSSDLDEK